MERVQVFRNKLPQSLLWEIQKFDAHPTADLIRDLEFTRYSDGDVRIRATKGFFLNKWLKLRRCLKSNKNYKETGQAWQIVDVEIRQLYLVFDTWKYRNDPGIDRLRIWVKRQYLEQASRVHLLDGQ